ncbi:MAG: 2Fe-2S iron-sulfur cluster-binding protein, partial [Anaerolineae bacterium]
GAPQIRNRGTVAGNLITASPANDTITPLWAMDATVTLASRDRGERTLAFDQFFLGVRKTALQPDEMLVRINVPALKPTERGTFLKLGLRQAQAISVVNVAVIVEFDAEQPDHETRSPQHVVRARIALGAVAPTIIRAAEAEAYLVGKELTDEVIATAAGLAAAATRPISDIRGSAEYRRDMARVLTARALRQLRDGVERADWPERPVLLQGRTNRRIGESANTTSFIADPESPISLILNGKPTTLYGARGKTLLRALREDAGLTGTKEGCAEGECGACTVWLDGMAVMSCLVPVERAAGCEVVTIEGLADLAPHLPSEAENPDERPTEKLHPLQRAFIEAGAVQCGYCTPGLLMSAANLLEEIPQPTADQIRQALTGNLCRCTGYYKILEAVDRAIHDQTGEGN